MIDLSKYIVEKLSKINKDTKLDNTGPETWEVGDIIVATFTYNMTLVKFYEIVKRTNKSFTLRQLKDKVVKGDSMQGEMVPIEGEYDKRENDVVARLNKWGSVKVNGYYCRRWDGEPVFFTHLD